MAGFKSSCLRSFSSCRDGCCNHLQFLFLDGGKFCAPPELREEILRQYMFAVQAGERVCMVEVKTEPAFVWFADLDFTVVPSSSGPSDEMVLKIACAMASVTGQHHATCTGCVVSISRRAGKTGVHAVFPGVHITREGALQLRRHCLAALSEYGVTDDVLDASVYRLRTGLRMLHSYKSRVDRNDPYRPCFQVSLDGSIQDLSTAPSLDTMLSFSVQWPPACALQFPSPAPPLPLRPVPASRPGRCPAVPPAHGLVRDLLARYYPEPHGQLVISSKKLGPCRVVLRSGSTACKNLVQGLHKQANIYFDVRLCTTARKVTILQRCFCGCPTTSNRRSGQCSAFAHTVCVFQLSPGNGPLIQELFGQDQCASLTKLAAPAT